VYAAIVQAAQVAQSKFRIATEANLQAREDNIFEIEIMPAEENRGERINRVEERKACGFEFVNAAGTADIRRKIKRYGLNHRYDGLISDVIVARPK
jgi:hypothetical protein